MSFSKLSFFALLLWALFGLEKVIFLKLLNLDGLFLQIIFSIILIAITMACVRRLGVINYLEAIMTALLWLVAIIVLDYFFIQPIVGEYFSKWQVWAAYGIMVLSIFFFHKKRHVQIRHELHSHHGHH